MTLQCLLKLLQLIERLLIFFAFTEFIVSIISFKILESRAPFHGNGLIVSLFSTGHNRNTCTSRIRRFASLEKTNTGDVLKEWKGALAVSSLTNSTSVVYDIEEIKKILPHRYPFLLVDKVVEFEAGKRAVGIKQITANEDQFNGHFPSRSIMPGVLQIEALAQLGGIVALKKAESSKGQVFFFAGVNGVKWKKPVVPGDTMVMEVEMVSWIPRFGIAKMSGRSYVDGKMVNEIAEMTFAFSQ